MPETYSVFNAAEYIETEEDAQEILRLSAEQDPGDGSVIRVALNTVARAQSMSASAYDAGLDIGNLYETLSEDGNPTSGHAAEGHPRPRAAAAPGACRKGHREHRTSRALGKPAAE